jgi:hypothetical protein
MGGGGMGQNKDIIFVNSVLIEKEYNKKTRGLPDRGAIKL